MSFYGFGQSNPILSFLVFCLVEFPSEFVLPYANLNVVRIVGRNKGYGGRVSS